MINETASTGVAKRIAVAGILALGIGGYSAIQADGCTGAMISDCQVNICMNTALGACPYSGCNIGINPRGYQCVCACAPTS